MVTDGQDVAKDGQVASSCHPGFPPDDYQCPQFLLFRPPGLTGEQQLGENFTLIIAFVCSRGHGLDIKGPVASASLRPPP